MRATSGGMTAPALLRQIITVPITVLLLCAAPGVALAIDTDRDPTANAGPDRMGVQALTGGVGTTVTLDGSASKERQGVADGTNANLNFAWTQLDNGAPAVTLTGADTAMPTFTSPQAPLGLTLTFSLTVTNTHGLSDTDEVAIMVIGGDGPVPPPPGFFTPVNTGSAAPGSPIAAGQTVVEHAGTGALSIGWIPPGIQTDGSFALPAGTPPVLGYRVYWYRVVDYPASDAALMSSRLLSADARSHTVSGLSSDDMRSRAHVVTVVAVNENGESDFPVPQQRPVIGNRHASDPCGTACLPYTLSTTRHAVLFSVPPSGGNREVRNLQAVNLDTPGAVEVTFDVPFTFSDENDDPANAIFIDYAISWGIGDVTTGFKVCAAISGQTADDPRCLRPVELTGLTPGQIYLIRLDTFYRVGSESAQIIEVFTEVLVNADVGIADAAGNERDGVTFAATLAGALTEPVTLDWAVTAGTPTDASPEPSGSITIAAGETEATFTVPTADNFVDEMGAAETFTVTLSASSAGLPNGAVIRTPPLTAEGTITDDDVLGINLSLAELGITEFTDDRTSYTVVLTSQPTGAVTVAVTSGDTAVATVAPATLTFTADNWNQPQTVTATGMFTPDDGVDTGRNTTIQHAATGGGYDSITRSVTVNLYDSFGDNTPTFSATISPQTYADGVTPDPPLTLPVATGGNGLLVYTLTPALSPGLTFDPATRVLSGTPTAPAPMTTYTYTVEDSDGETVDDTDTLNLVILVNGDVTVSTPGNLAYTMGRPITALTLPAGVGGAGALTHTLTGPASAALSTAVPGLAFDAATRVLTGTPTTVGETTLTYTATDTASSTDSVTFAITVAAAVSLTSPPGNQTYTVGRPTTALTLAATGGAGVLILTVTGVDGLPAGLSYDETTCVLSGIPTAAGMTTVTYTATDINGSTMMASFDITVAAAVALTAPNDQTYTMGAVITPLTLTATGGTNPLIYTLTGPNSGALPPGLTFSATTRALTGTPTEVGTTTLTLTATDDNGSTAMTTFDITVAVAVALTAPNDQTYSRTVAITPLTLPDATGGTGTLTYTLTGPNGTDLSELPASLSYATGNRVLSGTPTAVGVVTLTYTATDTNGSTASVTFTVTVVEGLALSTPDNQAYTINRPIPDLTLPEGAGGITPRSYTLTGPSSGPLPAGLTFDATNRVLTGTPTAMATTTLTYTATDSATPTADTASVTFDITVAAAVALTAPADQTYTMGTMISALNLPAGTGGTAPLTYTLTGPASAALSVAVPGLTFDATTLVLTGIPTTAATTILTYTVTDAHDSTASDTVTLTVAAQVALTAPTAQTYTMDTAITALTLPAGTGGTGALTYTLIGPGSAALSVAVPGLAFNATTRVLTGTPTTAAATTLTYTATGTNGSTNSVTFAVTVAASVAVTAPTDQTYTMGTTITALTLPAATGGTGTITYTLTGPASAALSTAVPGLAFDATTRVLTGTPTTAAATTLTYTATGINGSTDTTTFDITVAAQVALTTPNNQAYSRSLAITALTLPTATGGTGTITYTLTGPNGTDLSQLPAGLAYATGTRVLSGTPTVTSAVTLTYTATDTNGSTASVTFSITVDDTAPTFAADASIDDQTYTVNVAIAPLTLPAATGGEGTITYTLTPAIPGLALDAATGVLTGTPTTAAVTAMHTYTAMDADDNTAAGDTATLDFSITVEASVALTALTAQTYTQNTAITPLTLSTATGGTGTITYTLTGPASAALSTAVPGLTFDATALVLTGTPTTAAAATTLTYTATGTNGSTASVTFGITVAAQVALTAPTDQTYPIDTEILDLTLPTGTGGTGTLTYTLTGPASAALSMAVPGLTFTATTRVLTGTPTMAATTALTYTVTDDNGSTASVTFEITVEALDTGTFAALNQIILPEVARAMADSTTSSIARRIEQATTTVTDTKSATLTLNGRALSLTTLANAGSFADVLNSPGVAETLTAAARGLSDGSWQPAQMFGNSSFALPLPAVELVNQLMIWGRSDYRNVSGKSNGLDWDGNLISGRVGADAQVTDTLMAGLAISRQSGTFDATGTIRGTYDIDQTSFHPYLGWSAPDGQRDVWITLGYGWGEVEFDDQGEDSVGRHTADLITSTIGGGASALMMESGEGTLWFKGEVLQTQADVDGNTANLNVDARRIRLTVEGTHDHELANGAFLRPTIEVGLRHDAGDGETGTGAEIGGSLRFTHPARGLTLEGRWRALVAHTGDYGNWGISGMLRFKPRLDGQGVSMSLNPGYGDSTSRVQSIWTQNAGYDADNATAYRTRDNSMRMAARVGYGLALRTREGMLTPYGEMILGTTNSYRLGMIWKTGTRLNLTLLGERREDIDNPTEHSLLLKGEVRF